jgi:hypothetical protein
VIIEVGLRRFAVNDNSDKQNLDLVPPSYEPPRIEKVLTPEDLEREVQYAGVPTTTF